MSDPVANTEFVRISFQIPGGKDGPVGMSDVSDVTVVHCGPLRGECFEGHLQGCLDISSDSTLGLELSGITDFLCTGAMFVCAG